LEFELWTFHLFTFKMKFLRKKKEKIACNAYVHLKAKCYYYQQTIKEKKSKLSLYIMFFKYTYRSFGQ
jgi:hypothetical protein